MKNRFNGKPKGTFLRHKIIVRKFCKKSSSLSINQSNNHSIFFTKHSSSKGFQNLLFHNNPMKAKRSDSNKRKGQKNKTLLKQINMGLSVNREHKGISAY